MSADDTKKMLEEIARLKDELDHIRSYDELTGLYNRKAFIEKVRERFFEYPEKDYIIVCLDIEKFKFINDRFGFVEGDRLLSYVADKLKERKGSYDVVITRLTSDVYAFLDENKNIEPEAFGAEVQSWVKNYPLDVDIKIAVGIYHVESRTIPVRLMCDRARFAIDTVKKNYMINVAEYNKDVRDYMISQNELLNDIESAFLNHEYKVYLQPKFDIRTNKVVGAESLVRWVHPRKGLIPPRDFIPLFEQNMIIPRLDEYIWEETCRLIREWIDKGYKAVPVSVNVSRLDIFSLPVAEKFVAFTEKHGIDRHFIEIEITESAFANDENKILSLVDELRSLGFKVLMDDFGTGYSSLNLLKDINVDVLKIDTRFLEPGRNENNKGKEILESIIRMAKWIGLQTVAEGVETDAQKLFLLNLGCYYAQGFYFSKPISPEQFEEFIKNPDNVSETLFGEDNEFTIAIEELFTSDFMTERLLNNILGGFAIYEFDGKDDLKLIKANTAYSEVTGNYIINADNEEGNVVKRIHPDDRERVLEAFRNARTAEVEGVSLLARNVYDEKVVWISARIFYLAERGKRSIYYASLTDATEQARIAAELEALKNSLKTTD
ncbi:MAG: EAL domain-containing protein [Oscillospiraceae bacterium]|nr:EAL domain-containing protein [Oscillospiraceae bacterium]